MTTVTLIAPAGLTGHLQCGPGFDYQIAGNGTVTVDASLVATLLNAGFLPYHVRAAKASIGSPLPADLVSVSAAAVATNRALTIAAQPPHARKLQFRQVIVTAITAGVLTVVGVDQDGNAVTETVSLVAAATQTLVSKNAYASVTSATVTGLVGGGDGTLGIGVSNDFGVPGLFGCVTLSCVKATKVTKVLGTSNVAADDAASTATVDVAARTVAPTTAPSANGLVDFEFTVAGGLAD